MSVAYMLRTCESDMTSFGGFVWPTIGPVEAPDWSPRPSCGFGLHGLEWGVGDSGQMSWDPKARWLVVEYDIDSAVALPGKIKIPRGVVVYCGDRHGATTDIIARGAPSPVVGADYIVGDHCTAVASDLGSATAGNFGTATVGFRGRATAGAFGIATAGDCGTAMVGYEGRAAVGIYGAAIADKGGTAIAGQYSTIIIRWHDGRRTRSAVGYVGEDGILPGVEYRAENGKFVRCAR